MNEQCCAVNQPRGLIYLLLGCALLGILFLSAPSSFAAPRPSPAEEAQILSPIWGPTVQQWASYIGVLAEVNGLDPDLIAAVIQGESNGQPELISKAGAVGLMGVMPSGPGLEWRPSAEELKNPTINLRWGVGILSEVVRQSGGDLYAALAAYSGGWEHVDSKVPRDYAANVLDSYGRAVVVRNGGSPDIASQWTIAVEISRGYVPPEPLLVLGQQPLSGLHLYGKHLVYDYVDESGSAYYITGYAVPVALVVPLNAALGDGFGQNSVIVNPGVKTASDQAGTKSANSNPHVIMACLPSLSRLRGQASTRWFAPSQCPAWHR